MPGKKESISWKPIQQSRPKKNYRMVFYGSVITNHLKRQALKLWIGHRNIDPWSGIISNNKVQKKDNACTILPQNIKGTVFD